MNFHTAAFQQGAEFGEVLMITGFDRAQNIDG
jgi:hypothetical protein